MSEIIIRVGQKSGIAYFAKGLRRAGFVGEVKGLRNG